jgi:predicted acetyltransferase
LENKEYANCVGFVPATTYFMIREKDDKIIGMINLRHELNERLAKTGGHIGYSIRPTERKKGYAKIQLYLCLLKAKEIGLEKVMLTCDENNIASAKTMEALGAIFKRKEKEKDRVTKVYWINVNESIKKHENLIK